MKKYKFEIKFLDDQAKERYSENHHIIYGAVNHMGKHHVKDESSIGINYLLELGTLSNGEIAATFYYLKGQLCERKWEYIIINGETHIVKPFE